MRIQLAAILFSALLFLPLSGPSVLSATELQLRRGKELIPGVLALSDPDLPELADPYLTFVGDSVLVSGTGQYMMRFNSLAEFRQGGPYEVVWNQFSDIDGTPTHSWDMKLSLWSPKADHGSFRLWDPSSGEKPLLVWYGGHTRHSRAPAGGISGADLGNYSRDIFAYEETAAGKWQSLAHSIFSARHTWPRPVGSYLGHRYGHQIVMTPQKINGTVVSVPTIFYEEVSNIRPDGSPAMTRIYRDQMTTPYQVLGKPIELISPINPRTGKPYPSTVREDGSALVEGPLYFRFMFLNDEWEAIGFSAGSYYSKYTASFAYRRLSEGLQGLPFRLDLTDDGSDLHDAGSELRSKLHITAGLGRPAVVVGIDGRAITDASGGLNVLFHGYGGYGKGAFRVTFLSRLIVTRRSNGALRFDLSGTDLSGLTGNEGNHKTDTGLAGRSLQSLVSVPGHALARPDDPERNSAAPHSTRF